MKSLIFFLLISFHLFTFAEDGPPNEPPFNSSQESLDKELSEIEESDYEFTEDLLNEPLRKSTPQPPSVIGSKTETDESPPASRVESNIGSRSDVKSVPQFIKPPGPKQGGVLKVPHPNATKGLLKIKKDGSYQYKVNLRPKNQSSSLRVGFMTPPKIDAGSRSYKDFYGENNLNALNFEYEWQPFQDFGRLGLNLGTGLANAKGSGYFKRDSARSEEGYSLYIIPLSAFLTYRFEYMRRQWVVPYINGGGSLYGLVELRDDNKKSTALGSAAGGGGGLLFSISALDQQAAFILDREYGIADLYFTLEARAMQGASKEIDFTHQSINGGITVDF